MYISAYPSSEMVKFKSISDVHYVVGIVDSTILKPARCKVCGEFVYMDTKLGLYQCSHCNKTGTLYKSETLNLRKEWEVYVD